MRNSSEYIIVDRQYSTGPERFDLTGFFWPHRGRRRDQEVAPCIFEVKFALNNDSPLCTSSSGATTGSSSPELRSLRRNARPCSGRSWLALYDQPEERLEAMKTLQFARRSRCFSSLSCRLTTTRIALCSAWLSSRTCRLPGRLRCFAQALRCGSNKCDRSTVRATRSDSAGLFVRRTAAVRLPLGPCSLVEHERNAVDMSTLTWTKLEPSDRKAFLI